MLGAIISKLAPHGIPPNPLQQPLDEKGKKIIYDIYTWKE